jgi:hypothetical protein
MSELDDSRQEVDSSGVFSVDDEDQPGAGEDLNDRGVDDPLDEGYSPPEKPRAVESFGTTFEEAREGESLEQRIAQEVPDPNLQVDDPLADDDEEPSDDPDGEQALDEGFRGDDEVGDERAGRLVDPDEGVREDTEKDLVGEDVGIAGGAASAEEAAMHVVDEP